jgi:hypothetical protein
MLYISHYPLPTTSYHTLHYTTPHHYPTTLHHRLHKIERIRQEREQRFRRRVDGFVPVFTAQVSAVWCCVAWYSVVWYSEV